jgi:uncharacterized protein
MAVGGALGAQSFDCKLAKTDVEKAVCGSKALSAADSQLATEYKQMLGEVPADVQAELRTFERNWLRGLPAVCKANAPQMNLTDCLTKEYAGQMRDLKQRVRHEADVTFVVRTIELLEKDDADDPWKDEKDIGQNPGYGTLDASWPQALSSDPMWVAWNAAVVRETQTMAGADKTAKGWDKSLAGGADTTVTATLGGVTPQMVSVSITNDEMGHGAAHPGEAYETFHWLLKERRLLKVADVFTPGWEAVVTARCKASLRKQIGDDYQSYAGSTAADFAKTLHGVVADIGNWDIDAKGVTINFPEYSVTPRAEPVDPVTVPWSALRSFLNPNFVVPQ